jgi:hypothetical protein
LVGEVVAIGQQTHRVQLDSLVQVDVDYRWSTLLFDEVAQFLGDADAMRNSEPSWTDDKGALAVHAQRICDSGLSYQEFVKRLGRQAGIERLGTVHGQYSTIGRRLLDSDRTVAAWHITRIYGTVGITPWYFIPPPEMDALSLCARDPVSAARVLFDAASDFVQDVVGLCVASARVTLHPYYLQLRRRFGKVNLHVVAEDLQKHGLDPDMEVRSDMAAFSTNLLRNVGRRLYRTTTGYVGMGPPEMKLGDAVTVFCGGTTAHLLRQMATSTSGSNGELWEYVGEAYCDGVMNGEALETHSEVEFTLA